MSNTIVDSTRRHAKDTGLLLVGKRNRLLKYMASSNREGYLSLIKRLGLRK